MSKVPQILAGMLSCAFILLFLTPAQDFLANQVERPLEFKFRSAVGKSPSLDPRIKIYAFDEQTLAYLGYPDLTLDGWFHLIQQFSAAKPRAIYIDKLFSLPLQERIYEPLDPAHGQDFIERVQALPVPVISGGFISPVQLPGRKQISVFHSDYQFKGAAWPAVEQGYFYGPHPYIRDAFRVGHITNAEYGYAKPFFRIDPKSWIPHAAFLALGTLRAQDERLYLGDQYIPTNRKNLVPINFSDREQYYKRTRSLKYVLGRLEQKKAETGITEADIVVILPAMFTGNTDFKDTPVGRLQGGYFGVALLNSQLQDEWITETFAGSVVVLISGLGLAMFAALFLQPWLAGLILIVLVLGTPTLGLALFAWKGLSMAWLGSTLGSALGGIVVLVERMRGENHRQRLLVSSLRGALSPNLADSIAKNPAILQGDPVEQIVTVMFVDIVGFSLTTERLTAKETFQQLKSQIEFIVDKVHQFGGLVDKSLGDGVLAFFGYHFEPGRMQVGQADQALRCAIEIQKEALRRAEISKNSAQPIFPLRIGINTATVYIGNLGTEGRIDFTLIGNGVNFTARLEHACTPYRIMLGLATFDLLGQFSPRDPGVSSKEIRIKHHRKPTRCFEYNPFHAVEEQTQGVLQYYNDYHQIAMNDPRWYLESVDYIPVKTQFGPALLVNFSVGGVALIFADRLIHGVTVQLSLTLKSSDIPLAIVVQCCWAKVLEPGKVIHGCQYHGNSVFEQEAFIQGLRDHIQQLGKKAHLLPRGRPAA